jgi:spore coat protein U-like protein
MRLRVRLRGVALLTVCAAALQPGEVEALGVLATCTVANATLAFGTYNPVSGSPTLATAMIMVTCSDLATLLTQTTVPFAVTINGGNSGSVTNRTMTGSAGNLPYNIYETASYTTVWDNTTGVNGSVTLQPGLDPSTTTTLPAYGRILASQPVAVGSYSDSLMITVSF